MVEGPAVKWSGLEDGATSRKMVSVSFELIREREDEKKPCQCDDVTTKVKKTEVEAEEALQR